MCIRYKVTIAIATEPYCLLRQDGPDSTKIFYNREQERKVKTQKGREVKR